MKIRTDFVSNSSSSSFVLVGVTYEIDKFIKQMFSDSKMLDELNTGFKVNYNSIDEFLEKYDMCDIIDFLYEKFEQPPFLITQAIKPVSSKPLGKT